MSSENGKEISKMHLFDTFNEAMKFFIKYYQLIHKFNSGREQFYSLCN